MTRESQKKHLKQFQERPQPVRYILQFLFNLGDRFSSLLLLTHCTVTIIDRFFVIVIFIIIIHIFAVRQLVHFYCKLIVSGVPINPNRHGSFQTKKIYQLSWTQTTVTVLFGDSDGVCSARCRMKIVSVGVVSWGWRLFRHVNISVTFPVKKIVLAETRTQPCYTNKLSNTNNKFPGCMIL
jgi:hypothetical protein